MLYSYIVSGLFFILFILYLYLIGTAWVSNSKCIAYRILIGYLLYEFLIAIVGIPLQLLDVTWKYFMYYVVILIITLLIISLVRIKKYKLILFEEGILSVVKKIG